MFGKTSVNILKSPRTPRVALDLPKVNHGSLGLGNSPKHPTDLIQKGFQLFEPFEKRFGRFWRLLNQGLEDFWIIFYPYSVRVSALFSFFFNE
jgi:hypothetical protein